jgi:hypothetical protein
MPGYPCCCGETDCSGINAEFTWEETSPGEYDFDPSDSVPSTGATITGWLWELFTGYDCTGSPTDTSTDEFPTFTISGPVSVKLTVTDDEGCTDSECENLCDCPSGLTADFGYTQIDDDPCTFNFSDDSVVGSCGGAIVAWLWKCGDTVISTDQNPTGVDLQAICGGSGLSITWDITLEVTDSNGCTDEVVGEVECVITQECGCTTELPSFVTVTVSGFTNGTCANCTALNGTHLLSFTSGGGATCLYRKIIGVPSCHPTLPGSTNQTIEANVRGVLPSGGRGIAVRISDGIQTYRYELAVTNSDCHGTKSLARKSGLVLQCNSPLSVSITV